MAKTAFSTNDALTKKLWEEKLFRDTVKETYFAKFQGESADSLIQVKTELEKSKGDRITFGIRMRLQGAGVTSGQILEGNEERLTTYDYSLTLERYRHAVRDAGALDRQRVAFSIDEESVAAIKAWGAEKQDQLMFDALTDSPSNIFYKTSSGVLRTGTVATAKSALTLADSKLTPAMISYLKAWAKTGGGRTNALTPLRPVKVDGRSYYILLVHPDNMYDLKIDSTFTQALREAEIRGPQNPLFQGATAIWDGVVIHEHENIPIAADAGSGANVPWAHAVFMGAQSGLLAWGARPEVIDENFDYKEEHGYAWAMTMRAGKPKFDNKDYGCFAVFLSRTNVSGT